MAGDKAYEIVCQEKFGTINRSFDKIDQKLDKIETSVSETREKVFDGLSHLPARVNWLIGMLVVFLLGISSLVYVVGRSQARLETLIETRIEEPGG